MENKPKIVFFDTKPYDKEFFEKANESYGYQLKFHKSCLNEESAEDAKGYDVVCCFVNAVVDSKVIEILVSLGVKLLALRCAGYNNVDLKAADKKLPIVRVPQYSPYAVAEHAVTLMLALNRKIHRAYQRTRDGDFSLHGLMGFDMNGKTLGVVGTGKIGKQLIMIGKGFGMNILAHDIYQDDEFAKKHNVKYVSLEELYPNADIISFHCPLTLESYQMINRQSISMMKDGVIIINTGRGRLICTEDLIEGLKSHKIGAAGLDVYEEEDLYFFEDFSGLVISDDILARLMTFPNVLITAHQGFFTREALTNISNTTLENIHQYLEKGNLQNSVKLEKEDK